MRENKLRTLWKSGGAAVNAWLNLGSSYSAEQMGHAGWDSMTIDMQHGPQDFGTAFSILQAISTTDTVPFARVPWNEPSIIMRLLDAGCYGIICPMINNRAEAERFVGACRYAPQGYRSIGPNRAVLYSGSDYVAKANETVVTMAMIETAEAMANLDSIMSTPGLDAIYIGPSDLGQSLGFDPAADPTQPEVVEAVLQIVASARKHGVVSGMHFASVEYAQKMIAAGVQFATISGEARILQQAAMAITSAMRGGGKGTQRSGIY